MLRSGVALLQVSTVGRRCLTSKADHIASTIERIAVIGAGLMGSGISQSELLVTLVDHNEGQLAAAEKSIQSSVERAAKHKFKDNVEGRKFHVKEVLNRVKMSANLASSVSAVDLVIEVVTEKLNVKHKVLKQIEAAIGEKTLIATNTSSLSLMELAAVLKAPDRFGGLHFFNPVPKMKLVEVVRCDTTGDATFKALKAFTRRIDKTAVEAKDTDGFIVNRLLIPLIFEAVRMHERGDASLEDIDTAMKLGCGFPMGLFQLADFVGLDTLKFAMDGWHSKHPENPLFEPSMLLNELVAEGKLGMKSGAGFFDYSKKAACEDKGEQIKPSLVYSLRREG